MNRMLLIVAFAGAVACDADPCEDSICLDELPALLGGGGDDSRTHGFDSYSCDSSSTFPGPETVYRVTLEEDGFLAATIVTGDAGVAHVALLGSRNPDDCIDAHDSAVGARLSAGDYFVAVEANQDASDTRFGIQMALTTAATLESTGISPELAADALDVYSNAWAWGASHRTEYVIVDFTQHSATLREWVVDMSSNQLLWNLRVAHGRNSTDGVDLAHAKTFSNVSGSNQSSLGLMRSAGTYVGVFGPSFRIEGLEPSFNDNVCSRAIVMHPWSAVSDEYVDRCGWACPSLGCPAIDDSISLPVRDRLARPDDIDLAGGVLMLYWYPDTDWHAASPYLRGTEPTPELLEQQQVICDSSVDSTPTPPPSTAYACD